ncbi:MAG: acyltransferase [Hyphomonas sp.]|nr:acyltransferase [Hyphomonas sp.]
MSNPGSTPAMNRVDGFDMLRMVLAMLVVVAHYSVQAPRLGFVDTDQYPLWLKHCRYAVEVFFIVSGLMIPRVARFRSFSDFWVNRTSRLGPSLMICATITFVVTQLFSTGPLPVTDLKHYLASVTIYPLFFSEDWGADWAYWTITLELRFYLLASLFFIFFKSGRAILIGCAIWAALGYVACYVDSAKLDALVVNRASSSFIIGVLLYMLDAEPKLRKWTCLVMVAVWPLLPMQLLEASEHRDADFAITTIEATVISFVIIGTVLLTARIHSLGRLRKFSFLSGNASYPLYLIHQFVGFVLIYRLIEFGIDWRAAVAISIVVVTITAYAVTHWLEDPLSRFIRPYLKRVAAVMGRGWDFAFGWAKVKPKPAD